VAFGRPLYREPDLANGLELDGTAERRGHSTFYAVGRGYTDYPFLEQVAAE